jgi:hypothetical protein
MMMSAVEKRCTCSEKEMPVRVRISKPFCFN